jgi:hypothetical protein
MGIEQVIVDTDEITHRQKLLNSYFGGASQVSGSDQLCGVSARQTAKVMLSAIRSQFSESDDDLEVVRKFTKEFDTNKNGKISVQKISQSFIGKKDNKEMVDLLMTMLARTKEESAEMTVEEFVEVLNQLPRVRAERIRWSSTLRLDAELARYLPAGDIFDGLKGLKEMEDDQLDRFVDEVCTAFAAALPGLLYDALGKLREPESMATDMHTAQKYSMESYNAGSIRDFHNGLGGRVG